MSHPDVDGRSGEVTRVIRLRSDNPEPVDYWRLFEPAMVQRCGGGRFLSLTGDGPRRD